MTSENPLVNLRDLNLRELGYWTTHEFKECYIAGDYYHFKWWYEEGEFRFTISELVDSLEDFDFYNKKMEFGMASKEVVEWFNKDREPEPKWDAYRVSAPFGYFSIEPYSGEKIKLVLTNYLIRL
jgi:hypothetical protein